VTAYWESGLGCFQSNIREDISDKASTSESLDDGDMEAEVESLASEEEEEEEDEPPSRGKTLQSLAHHWFLNQSHKLFCVGVSLGVCAPVRLCLM
jgi:hypothetical protein